MWQENMPPLKSLAIILVVVVASAVFLFCIV